MVTEQQRLDGERAIARAPISDRLFKLHAEFNRMLGAAVIQIMAGEDVGSALTVLRCDVIGACTVAFAEAEEIRKEAGL